MDQRVGAWSGTQDATEEVQSICDEVKCQVEEKTGKNYAIFKAVQYRSQLVQGMNYLIKVHAGGDDHVHLRVFQALPCYGGGIELHSMQQNKSREDSIELF